VTARWGDRDILTITRRDLQDLLDELSTRASRLPQTAFCLRPEDVRLGGRPRHSSVVPFPGNQGARKEIERDRVLTDDELVRIWNAAEQIGGIAGGYFKVLILTGNDERR